MNRWCSYRSRFLDFYRQLLRGDEDHRLAFVEHQRSDAFVIDATKIATVSGEELAAVNFVWTDGGLGKLARIDAVTKNQPVFSVVPLETKDRKQKQYAIVAPNLQIDFGSFTVRKMKSDYREIQWTGKDGSSVDFTANASCLFKDEQLLSGAMENEAKSNPLETMLDITFLERSTNDQRLLALSLFLLGLADC